MEERKRIQIQAWEERGSGKKSMLKRRTKALSRVRECDVAGNENQTSKLNRRKEKKGRYVRRGGGIREK